MLLIMTKKSIISNTQNQPQHIIGRTNPMFYFYFNY
ncbi:unnamed protein product [Linum tenue]|uniref:Uncharacterized protein n=1 Tax=Linum tenue TaxID=586396 RepID=A0AAV0KWJ6_9ROSI|nr:unnamed protein product [Linum tenue]